MIRLGYTESQLLFYYYLDKTNVFDKKEYEDRQNNLINWLYSTSGFYDKNVPGTYFNFDAKNIKSTETYNKYFEKVLKNIKSINNCKIKLNFHNSDMDPIPQEIKDDFNKYININNKVSNYSNVLSFMSNKKILIINNLSSLMKKQYESGNVKKICPDFPDNIIDIKSFEIGYTFLNSGPHKNILQTYRRICRKIKDIEFDGAIISAGAYSSLLAYHISTKLKKEVYVCGGDLPNYFGVKTLRADIHHSHLINEHWIPVPEHMKPANYKKIEDGIYW
jgi:hypothetical protein